MALLIQPLAPWIIQILYGNEFTQSPQVLSHLIWTLVPFIGVTYGSLILVVHNQEKWAALGHGIALILAVALGFIFFDVWGLSGLVWGLVAAEAAHAGTLLWFVQGVKQNAS